MPNPGQLPKTQWAPDGTLVAADKKTPEKIIYMAARRAADPSLRPGDATRGPGDPADNPSQVSSIRKARDYLSAAEKTALGL